jgi:hypothetical protein
MREQDYIDIVDLIDEQLIRYNAKLQIQLTEKFEKMKEQLSSQIDEKIQKAINNHIESHHFTSNIRSWLGS